MIAMPELTGRRALVTGANSGIGLATARELARAGAHVVLACRDGSRGQAALTGLRRELPAASLELVTLNLASLSSVARCAESIAEPLHLLVNNAGVMAPRQYRQTEDGFELQFGVNHLGHFALTGRLLPQLLAAGDARVVSVASLAHSGGGRDVLFGNPESGYRAQHAYSNSKLANLLFGRQLQQRAGGRLTSTMAHPGITSTNLFLSREGLGANPLLRWPGRLLGPLLFQSAPAGAQPTLYAATAAEPGSYTGPRWPGEFRGAPAPAALSPLATDDELAAQLWELSQEWTGVRYPW